MKDERNVRHHRAEGARWRPAALLLAAVLIATSLPFFGKSVFAADPEDPAESDGNCSLTVLTNQGMQPEDLANLSGTNVMVDIYLIADAVKDQMYDTYNLTPVEELAAEGLTLPTGDEGWDATKQMASDLILGREDEKTQWKPKGAYAKQIGTTLGQSASVLPGIYFVVVHGTNTEDYVSKNESGDVITLVETPNSTYQFFTELVMVPTKEPVKDPETGEEKINTANPGPWNPNVELRLKPAVKAAHGDLYIIKKLDEYEQREKNSNGKTRDIIDDATFVFEVTAYKSKEDMTTVIYHEFISMTFTEAVTKTAVVKDIPAGSYVKVEEVYSGKSYEAVISDDSTSDDPKIQYVESIKPAVGEDADKVTFENIYDDRPGGGGSVTNHFSFDGKWDVEQVTDNSTEGEHVSNPLEERIDKSADSNK